MAYLNDNSFCSASVTPGEFDSHPFLQSQTLVTTETYPRATPTFVGGCHMVDQPEPLAVPLSLPVMSHISVSPAFSPHPARSHGSHWSMITQSTQPDHPCTLSLDNPFAGAQECETAMQAINLNPVPTDSWGSRQVTTDVPYVDNQLNHRRPWPDATRAGVMGGRRFTPYGTYNAHPSTYWNAAAVASTQVPQPVPCGTWPTKQPTGGSSGATAAAEQTNQITEEEESPAPRTRRARGEGLARPHRRRNQEDVRKLRTWAKGLRGLPGLPSHQDAISAATEIVSVLRGPVYAEDHLLKGHGRRKGVGSKGADEEYERRNGTRQVYQNLSRYYRLERGRSAWSAPQLLLMVLEDLENLGDLLRHA